jgi:hypothetical protein
LVLGCKIYVREVASNRGTLDGGGGKESGGLLQEGDILLKINNHTTEGLSLKEVRKLIEASKEKLNLVVRREHKPGSSVESTAVPKGTQCLISAIVPPDCHLFGPLKEAFKGLSIHLGPRNEGSSECVACSSAENLF